MKRKEMLELIKRLQEEGSQCHGCDLILYVTEQGALRTQLLTGSYEFREGFADIMTFGEGDTRDPEILVDYIEPIDGFPPMNDWYVEDDF